MVRDNLSGKPNKNTWRYGEIVMDSFKRANVVLATAVDLNCKCCKSKYRANDKRMVNRYARRKLRRSDMKDIDHAHEEQKALVE